MLNKFAFETALGCWILMDPQKASINNPKFSLYGT